MELDCQSYESTLNSIQELFSCNKSEAFSLLDSMNYEEVINLGESYVFESFEKEFGRHSSLSKVYGFHLTRVLLTERFEDGLLPFKESFSKIWEILTGLFSENTLVQNNLLGIRKNGSNLITYRTRVNKSTPCGPYGMLIREAAFFPKDVGQRAYLYKLPEIIEDICKEYEKRHDIEIEGEVLSHLKPCIVKFSDEEQLKEKYIYTALNYLFAKRKQSKLTRLCQSGINREGMAILNENIVDIDFIDEELLK